MWSGKWLKSKDITPNVTSQHEGKKTPSGVHSPTLLRMECLNPRQNRMWSGLEATKST